jgi:hypothetical protein
MAADGDDRLGFAELCLGHTCGDRYPTYFKKKDRKSQPQRCSAFEYKTNSAVQAQSQLSHICIAHT